MTQALLTKSWRRRRWMFPRTWTARTRSNTSSISPENESTNSYALSLRRNRTLLGIRWSSSRRNSYFVLAFVWDISDRCINSVCHFVRASWLSMFVISPGMFTHSWEIWMYKYVQNVHIYRDVRGITFTYIEVAHQIGRSILTRQPVFDPQQPNISF